ncbi:MAG: hypothetical protein DPW17_12415 [Candidatus Jettenia sp.]|uniref:hypothetical protein n=1 Tax=Candidatus Jettenia sp. AMX1 TaxID=2293637 RepID=UPI00058E89B5|nr:hypothetical protein [Candidatus Jettenia sp. AMX1]MCE7881237.1 hypothetical protein [Candidatus Jettenia sp. AMX1]MCQ3928078.1 hypothetical protein [Candidatus Jettenia sp.]MDL1939626.1 hypothetical protein [Candidatus Jettenia sp. AMX1]NUO09986.1 hypothetical protein [Candidatus Brocadia sp.]
MAKKIGLSAAGTAAVLLTGPLGIAAALMSGIFTLYVNRQLKNLAKNLCAIDSFELTGGISVFVTETHFIMILSGAGSSIDLPGFLRSDLHNAFIDEGRSKSRGFIFKERTVLHLDYFDTNYRKREVHEDYKFKGKNSRPMAELAFLKFMEYQIR